jgi:hypothetical protein
MATTIERASARLGEIAAALGPVSGDVGVAQQLLAVLGWDLPPGVSDIGLAQLDVAAIATRLRTLAELRSRADASDLDVAAAFGEVIAALVQTFAHVEDLARSLQATPEYLAASGIADQFFPRLADLVVIEAVRSAVPSAIPIGVLVGVFEFPRFPADPATFQIEHVRSVVRWDRFSPLVTDPTDILRDVYGWGTPAFKSADLVVNLGRVVDCFAMDVFLDALPRAIEEKIVGHPVPEADTAPGSRVLVSLDQGHGFDGHDVGVTLYSLRATTAGGTDGGIGISPYARGTAETTFPLSDTLSFVLTASGALESGIGLLLRAGGDPELVTGIMKALEDADPSFDLALRFTPEADDQRLELFSAPNISADVAAITAGVRIQAGATLNPTLHGGIEDGRIRVASDRSDGFLASILPADGVTATVKLDASWSHQDGLRIEGGAGLRTVIGLHARLGPLQIDTMSLAIAGSSDALLATATVNGAVVLGPFTATLESIGTAIALRFERGNLGPADLSADFIPPLGVGLSIDAAAISGGGFIRYDPVARRYSGILELHAGQVDISAVGVLDAKLPGGAPGFALLIALRASFPGIQIGFGFALTAVGGLLALNRRVDVDAVRSLLASGTAGRILAPEDPIRNAPALLADLDAVFPIARGVTVVGPTAQLVWAKLVHFDIGVFIELPGPSRIVLLGSARAAIEGAGRTYLLIRVDIVGVVDLQQRIAAFDAVLIGSQLLEILELTGGAAFRLSWGEQPYALLTVGGFHPAYSPEPLVLPASLTRIAMVHGTPEDRLYLRFEGYFAVTSNTLQFGAAVQAIIRSGNFNIQGIVAFDALIRFQPFHFRIDIRASVRVRYKSRNLAGLTLTGSLEGPGPIVLRAKVCIELLFFDICFSQTFTLGSSDPPPVTTIGSALAVFTAQLDDPATLRAGGGTDRLVAVRPPPQGSRPIVSPVGQLVWVQREAPLGVLLQRIGGAPLAAPQSVEATSADATAPELDFFAPGSFADLTDDQALTRRAFERLPGGLRFGAGGEIEGPSQQRTLSIKQIRLPAKAQTTRTPSAFPLWVVAAAARAQGAAPAPEPIAGVITVTDERWTVLDAATGATLAAASGAQAHQLAALGAVRGSRVAIPAGDRLSTMVF